MADLFAEIVELEAQETVAVRGDVALADLPAFFARAYREAAEAASAAGVQIVGPPFGFYPEMPTEKVVVEAGFPVSSPVEPRGNAHPFLLPGGPAVRAIHVGPYETMEQTYKELELWMQQHAVRPAIGMWERYLSDPTAEPDPATWRTEIIWPLA